MTNETIVDTMSAKERVLAVHEYADVVHESMSYIWRIISDALVLGVSMESEDAAWEDAASKLPAEATYPQSLTVAGGEEDINDPSPVTQLRRHHEWQMEHADDFSYRNSHLFIMTQKALAAPSPATPALEPRVWTDLPKKQGLHWHWDGNPELAPFPHQVLASLSGAGTRYFIQYPDSRWCDEVGGLWFLAEVPALPVTEIKNRGM